MFNPIILDQEENFLEWLNPELIDIEETNEMGELRTVSVSYPIIGDIKHTKELFRIGNKLWIPEGAGLTSCLYVISSECKQDYFDKNSFSFNAEDILVELNYAELWTQETSKTVPINETNLDKWFGMYYHIGTVEKCTPESAKSIENNGTMNKLEWLRYIEEQTGNIFITRYEKDEDSNIILRYLDFKNPDTIGNNHANSIIDLGYNADNIVYEIDESDTYRAIAPIFSLANENGTSITGTTVTREELTTVINNWKNHSVTKGTLVPMILERDSDGKIKTPVYPDDYWTAPFTKKSGEMFIYDPVDTGAEYNYIRPRKDYEGTIVNIPKVGTIDTSETDKRIIFNNCCNTLLEKRYPTVNLEVDIKDLDNLLGYSNNSYDVYDTLKVKVPELTHLVECRIVQTVKNPHTPNENKISLSSTSLSTRVNQIDTQITNINSSVTVKKGKYLTAFLKTAGVGVTPEVLKNKEVTIAVVKPSTTKTVTYFTKDPVKTTVNVAKTNVITIKAKPSCAYKCGSYKWYTTSFVNKCPFCGGKLSVNPKGVPERELTCKKCGADFCGVCGREKRVPYRKRLTKSSSTGTKKTTTKYVQTKHTKKVTDQGWTKIYNVKTDSTGKINFNIPFDKGTYTVTISYGGSIEYGMCSRNVKLTVS